MKRDLRPRATDALAVTPVAITDWTFPLLAGLSPRAGRALVVKLGIRHVIVGKRMIVLVDDFVDGLRRAGHTAATEEPAPTRADDETPSVDGILARLGRRRAA